MSNQVFVRVFDADTKLFAGCHYEDPDYQLKDNETFVAIPDGMFPPYKFVKGNWIGSSSEDFKKAYPMPEGIKQEIEAAQKADLTRKQLNANLMKQVATLLVGNATQAKVNATALRQVAQLRADSATQDQVNANLMKESAMLKIQLAQLRAGQDKPQPALSAGPEDSMPAPSEPVSTPVSAPQPTVPLSAQPSVSQSVPQSAPAQPSASQSVPLSTPEPTEPSQPTEGVTENV